MYHQASPNYLLYSSAVLKLCKVYLAVLEIVF